MWKLVGALALVLHVVLGAIPEHEIESLPGYDGKLPSRQYSGYLNVDSTTGKYLHYWFVESMNDPATDPVMLWLNGGPGCSSLDGFLYEMGPFKFAEPKADSAIPTLVQNEYAWNNVVNMLYLEAPAGVGFSYSDTSSDLTTNDNQTAADNLRFLQLFFASYPEYAANDFYISGESYAGVYVPTLAEQVMLSNDANTGTQINMKGFLVGNGCTGHEVGACSSKGTQISIDYLFGHGLYSANLHADVLANCPDPNTPSLKCRLYLDMMSSQIGNVNIYNIYDQCIDGGFKRQLKAETNSSSSSFRKFKPETQPFTSLLGARANVGGPDECIDGIEASQYLNNDEVRTAIHVRSVAVGGQWEICTNKIRYTSNIPNLYGTYLMLASKYRGLIYSGDTDACVPYTDSEAWTSGLGLTELEAWRPWSVDSQVAGYVTTYSPNNFTFLTVKGAGHMVPEYKPVQAYAMLERYLNREPY